MAGSDHFLVELSGTIESCTHPTSDDLFCESEFFVSDQWQSLAPCKMETQMSKARPQNGERTAVWGMPFQASFQSATISGWPQMVVCVHASDFLGRQVLAGYGAIHVPCCTGTFTLQIPIYKPLSSSFSSMLRSVLSGTHAKFTDPMQPAKTKGREVVRTRSAGYVTVRMSVILRNFRKCGYQECPPIEVVR